MSPRLPFAGLIFCALAAAQPLSVGIIGGASLTPDFKSSFTYEPPPGPGVLTDYSASERYIVGGMLEFQFLKDWSIEVDALFHPLRFDFGTILPNGTLMGGSPSPVTTWEFPVLAKYRFRWGSWRPFLEDGPTFRTAGNLNGTNPSQLRNSSGGGRRNCSGKIPHHARVPLYTVGGGPQFIWPLHSLGSSGIVDIGQYPGVRRRPRVRPARFAGRGGGRDIESGFSKCDG